MSTGTVMVRRLVVMARWVGKVRRSDSDLDHRGLSLLADTIPTPLLGGTSHG
jgi:hypothetical protein